MSVYANKCMPGFEPGCRKFHFEWNALTLSIWLGVLWLAYLRSCFRMTIWLIHSISDGISFTIRNSIGTFWLTSSWRCSTLFRLQMKEKNDWWVFTSHSTGKYHRFVWQIQKYTTERSGTCLLVYGTRTFSAFYCFMLSNSSRNDFWKVKIQWNTRKKKHQTTTMPNNQLIDRPSIHTLTLARPLYVLAFISFLVLVSPVMNSWVLYANSGHFLRLGNGGSLITPEWGNEWMKTGNGN